MGKSATTLIVGGMALISIFGIVPALAQTGSNDPTFLSGTGSDSGGCLLTPCRTLTYALTQTLPGGHIFVTANWLSFNENPIISGSVTIDGGTYNSSFGSATGTALTINASTNDIISLKHLSVQNFGTATNGIVFNSGGGLFLKDTQVSGFGGVGLTFSPNTSGGTSNLMLEQNSRAAYNFNGNVLVRPVGSTNVIVGIKDGVLFGSSTYGFKIDTTAGAAQVDAEIVNSVIFNLGTNGVTVNSPTYSGSVLVYQTHISELGNYGVYANGANAKILLNNSTITHAALFGVYNHAGGVVASYGNNAISLNANDNVGILTPLSPH